MSLASSSPVIVCGSVAFDTIMVFEGRFQEHILPEHMHSLSVSFLVPSMRKEFGGCAGNIAYSLRMLGGQPVPVATVGEDAEVYLSHLRQLGVETNWVRVVPGTFTAQCFITTDLADNQITAFHPGAMQAAASNDLADAPGRLAIVAPDAKEGMFAHAQRLHARGIPFIFDLGQAMPLFDGDDLTRMLSLAQFLTVNDYEAHVVEQRTGRSMADLSRRLRAVVVTRGEAGSTLLRDGQETLIEPVRAERVVDPTGCGDAYRAGLLYGMTLDWDLADCCRLASLMGALKIAQRGPQNHWTSRAEIARLLQAHYGLALPDAA